MTYQPNRPTLRAYWAHEREFPIFTAVKNRLPFRAELLTLHSLFPVMRRLHEQGIDPEQAIAQAHLRYLLHDLANPLEVWPPLTGADSRLGAIQTRSRASASALTRAERKLRMTITRIDKGPRQS